MRSILLFVYVSLCLTCSVACRDSSAAAVATPANTASLQATSLSKENFSSYSLVIPESFVNWKGMNVIGGNGHQGYIKPLMGNLTFDPKGAITGGYFELDMNTITITDKKDTSSDNDLVSHLKDPDFFDVKKYPRAKFQLTKAIHESGDSSCYITGQLTLRDITHEVHFPARVVRSGGDIFVTASLTIDRTKWGITYKSGSVFGLVKDELLEDSVPVWLALVFEKKRNC